jgi:hypothetical protein
MVICPLMWGDTWFLTVRGECRWFWRTECRGEATGCRKLNEEKLINFYPTYTIMVIKSKSLI